MPEMCVAGDENFSKEKLLSMYSQAEKAYRLFDDDISKLTFEKLTAFKITGKLSYLREIFTDKDKITEILPLGETRYTATWEHTQATLPQSLSHAQEESMREYMPSNLREKTFRNA